MLKGRTKYLILFSSSGFIVFFIIVIVIVTISISIMLGSHNKKENEENAENTVEHFTIKGTKFYDLYSMKFIFDTWSIKGIKVHLSGKSGNLDTKVNVPKVSGTNEAIVYQVLRRAGYAHGGTCGIMGNINAESSFNACILEGQNSWTSGKSGNARGYGLCQWTNTTPPYTKGRRTNVINWLKSHGYNPTKNSGKLAEGQAKYMLIEKGYDGVRNRVKKETNVARATEIWLRGFEGIFNHATYRARVGYANEYDKTFKNKHFSKGNSTQKVSLNLKFEVDKNEVSFIGKLNGTEIAGNFTVKNGKISGSGEYGEGAVANSKGGFSGAEKNANATQRRIVRVALSYHNPYRNGFTHLCELWVATVYRKAGLSYNGSCCASASRDKNARLSGKLPVGAVIYSGRSYHSSVTCECGRNAGHVAIYVGGGNVAGSQVPFIMPLSQWTGIFGYGGWSFAGNKIR